MNKKDSEEQLEKDKLLLKMMIHYYDEDERRNELIDSKNSQMIVLTGAMLTLQATLFSNLLIGTIFTVTNINHSWKILVSLLMIISLGLLFYSMYLFINAYVFVDDFHMAPNPEWLIEYHKIDDSEESEMIEGLLENFNESVRFNDDLIRDKIKKGEDGFKYLKYSGISTLLLIILIIHIIL